MKILLRNVRAVDPQTGLDCVTNIYSEDGIIKSIGSDEPEADRVIEGEGRLVAVPGLFDMHVHFRDPGLTYKEDILTGAAEPGLASSAPSLPSSVFPNLP